MKLILLFANLHILHITMTNNYLKPIDERGAKLGVPMNLGGECNFILYPLCFTIVIRKIIVVLSPPPAI